jgi:hypothetical protein
LRHGEVEIQNDRGFMAIIDQAYLSTLTNEHAYISTPKLLSRDLSHQTQLVDFAYERRFKQLPYRFDESSFVPDVD